jgi:hypothetical protein
MTRCGKEGCEAPLAHRCAAWRLPQPIELTRYILPFPPRCSSGTASGQFLRPAASPTLLSSAPPKKSLKARRDFSCPSEKASPRFGSSALSLFSAPSHRGRKGDFRNVPQFSSDHRVHRQRPRATPGARQRRCIHRSFGCHAAVMEERGRRVGLEDRMASRGRYMESGVSARFTVARTAPQQTVIVS